VGLRFEILGVKRLWASPGLPQNSCILDAVSWKIVAQTVCHVNNILAVIKNNRQPPDGLA
jgi:hypothetical protein